MLEFNDIIKLDNRSIQLMLKELETEELTYALKGASDEVKDKIFSNMSERAQKFINNEIDILGGVEPSDIKKAQKHAIDVVNKLKKDGVE